jgi:hypothetical protein
VRFSVASCGSRRCNKFISWRTSTSTASRHPSESARHATTNGLGAPDPLARMRVSRTAVHWAAGRRQVRGLIHLMKGCYGHGQGVLPTQIEPSHGPWAHGCTDHRFICYTALLAHSVVTHLSFFPTSYLFLYSCTPELRLHSLRACCSSLILLSLTT